MNRVIAIGLLLALPLSISCQKGAVTEGPPQNFYYTLLKTYVAKMDQNQHDPELVAEALDELVAELDNAQYEDLGSNKGTVDQMTTAAAELTTLVENKASAEEIAGKIQQLSSAANSLPGEVDATMLATPPEE